MKSGPYLRLTASLIFAALTLLIGGKILTGGGENLRTVTAETVSIRDEKSLAGVIVREEKLILSDGDYFVIPEEGQWLSAGDAVAVKKEAVKAYSDYLSASEKSVKTDSAGELFSALSMSKNAEERRLFSASASELLFGKTEKESEHIPLPRELVLSEYSGYFSRFCDGYEELGLDGDYSKNAEIPRGCLGKIVCGDCWFFIAETDAETEEKLRVGMEVTLGGYTATVEEICGGKTLFRLREGLREHLTDRAKSLTLSISTFEGISLPPEAVFTEDGKNYIRILHTGGEEKLPVDIIYSGEDFILVSGEGLLPGARVILP